MNRIKIGAPYMEKKEQKRKVIVPVTIVEEGVWRKSALWYEVDSQFEKYLYLDRVDPFVTAVLPYCMKNAFDIEVDQQTGVSEDLLFQIRCILIPTMAMADKFQGIEFLSAPVREPLINGTGVATGISRGVDSFYTILKSFEGPYKPDYFTLFNTQAYGEYGGEASVQMFERDFKIAEKLCLELNDLYGSEVKILAVHSNIQEVFPIRIYDAGSFRDAGAILLLKQLIGLYYFSTTVSLKDFTVNGSCREFEPWLFACLTTSAQRIQPVGADKRRIEKAEYIADYPITYKYLKVCRKPLMCGTDGEEYAKDINCTSLCEKCRCTVLEFMALGKLHHYDKVFDLDWVEAHKTELLYEVISKQNQKGELDFSDIYTMLKYQNVIDDYMEMEVGLHVDAVWDAPPDRDYRILELMDKFFEKVQEGMCISSCLRQKDINRVGVYGYGRLGKLLCREIGFDALYVIDRKDTAVCHSHKRKPDDDFSDLDLIIITTVYNEDKIKKYLFRKGAGKVITLSELLDKKFS
ncbi:MAG: hypothetical protein HFH24_11055 [Ruminococcus sp.]|nr:hypothetical protein [Ruminococcus sp.]